MEGVTSDKDLGALLEASLQVKDRINKGKITGLTMCMSGPFLQHKPYPGTEKFRWGLNGTADAISKVNKFADAGVDYIKLIDHDDISFEEVKALVDQAHKRKLTVVAHGYRSEEIQISMKAEVDCFEHTGLSPAPEFLMIS
jgi:imidazolonepropionase-like amidohydrolase